ncbi:MAG: hypothetical protein V4714_10785 [Bacteroidota bacterium]
MTNIEFRMFFDALPDTDTVVKGSDSPSKSAFAKECDVPLAGLRDIATGKRALSEAIANKLLPVMQKYGFQGDND